MLVAKSVDHREKPLAEPERLSHGLSRPGRSRGRFRGGLTSIGGGAAASPGRPPAGTPGRSGAGRAGGWTGAVPGVLLGSALAAAMPKQRLPAGLAVLADARESLEDFAPARAAAGR